MLRSLLFLLATVPLLSRAALLPGWPSSTRVYTNVSSITSSGSRPEETDVCCFVLQDEVRDGWWSQINTYTETITAKLTAFTTYLSSAGNGSTATRVEQNVNKTTWTTTYTTEDGIDPLNTPANLAPGPHYTGELLEARNVIVTAGVTVSSPAAFYVYSTLRIITASALTNVEGASFCGTATKIASSKNIFTYSDMNPYVQAYYGGLGIAGRSHRSILHTKTIIHTFPSPKPNHTTTTISYEYINFYTDSLGSSIDESAYHPTGVVISLTTPIIYLPVRGATGKVRRQESNCDLVNDSEAYGYVPRTVVDALVRNPHYSSQYPGLASCLPGGPSIMPPRTCLTPGVTIQRPGYDLTTRTTIYLRETGSPSDDDSDVQRPAVTPPDALPVTNPPTTENPPPPSFLPPALPQSTPPPSSLPDPTGASPPGAAPQNTPSAPPTGGGAQNPPGGSPPAPAPLPPSPSPPFQTSIISGTPNIIIPGPTTIPLSLLPRSFFPSSNPNPVDPSNQANPTPPPATADSTIPSLPPGLALPAGLSTTLISSTPYLIIPSATSIPIPGAFPGPLFVTDGTTHLIITGPTTIPLPSNGAFSVSGVTVVRSQGTSQITEVVVPGPTTVVVREGGGASATRASTGSGSGTREGSSTGTLGLSTGAASGARSGKVGGEMYTVWTGVLGAVCWMWLG